MTDFSAHKTHPPIALVFFCAILLGFNSWLYAADDPSRRWHELESAHFVIRFSSENEPFARRAIAVAEEAHQALSPRLNWTPKAKTQLRVIDDYDTANGWARCTPRREIAVYTYPPLSTEEIGDYDDWMRVLIYHEYVHILHIDTSYGVHVFLNAIFGDFARANATMPRWYTEGLAVYYETELTQSGRLRSTLYRTMFELIARDGRIPSLGELSALPIDWPAGSGDYLFGAYFIAHLAQKFGPDKLTEFNHHYGATTIPYGLNRSAYRVFGKMWNELYEDWRNEAQKLAQEQEIKEKAKGQLSSFVPMMPAHRHSHARPRPHHQQVAFLFNDGYRGKHIALYDQKSKTHKTLLQCAGSCKFRFDETGENIYYSHATSRDGIYLREELYRYHMDSQKIDALTRDGRVRALALDGDKIYWVAQEGIINVLYRQDQKSAQRQELYRGVPYEVLDDIDVHQNQIVATRFVPEKAQQDIYLSTIDCPNKEQNQPSQEPCLKWLAINDDSALDLNPYFDGSDGIYYVSNRNDYFNLYRHQLDSGETQLKTHLLSGILHPTADHDSIYFTTYTSLGTTIVQMDKNELFDLPMLDSQRSTPRLASKAPQENLNPMRDYRPWLGLMPLNWMPSLNYDTINGATLGFQLSGYDWLARHQYQVAFDYAINSKDLNFAVDYTYGGLLWDLGFSFFLQHGGSRFWNGERFAPYPYQLVSGDVLAQRTLNHRLIQQQFTLAFHTEYTRTRGPLHWPTRDPAALPVELPSLGWNNALIFRWSLANMRQGEKAFWASSGYSLSTMLKFEAPWLASPTYAIQASTYARANWTLPYADTHIVGTRAGIGASWSLNTKRQPFQLDSNNSLSLSRLTAIPGADVMLHGFPSGVARGKYFLYAHLFYGLGIWDAVLGYDTLPIGIHRLSASGFVDWAYAWSDNFDINLSKLALGAILHIDLSLGYRIVQRLNLGYAWGAGPKGQHQFFIFWDY